VGRHHVAQGVRRTRGTSIQDGIFKQEEAKVIAASGVFAVGIGMAGPTLIAHGTDEQKERYLRRCCSGEEVWCQLFSEPGAGSDLGGLRTMAVRDGDEWIVNGQKVWTSGRITATGRYC
jgi:alkylation response protein AidB-like acyl-CoA dehydrogenase